MSFQAELIFHVIFSSVFLYSGSGMQRERTVKIFSKKLKISENQYKLINSQEYEEDLAMLGLPNTEG